MRQGAAGNGDRAEARGPDEGSRRAGGRCRYLVCIPDGAADDPSSALGGRTPLEVASMPVLSALALAGRRGEARTIPTGMPAASDVGIMAILGYDPAVHHTGRAPLEAASLGVPVRAGRTVFRANLVTVDDDGTMVDFSGGHPPPDLARQAVRLLQDRLGGEATFHAGLGYRNLMVAPRAWGGAVCVPPHDTVGRVAPAPRGPGAAALSRVMAASRTVLDPLPMAANQIWLWGQGTPLRLPAFRHRYGVGGALVGAVHVARGTAVAAGLTVLDAPGATGWYDTDYAAKRDTAIAAYRSGADVVVVHVAATDEAGHAGDLRAKTAALEAWDRQILDGLTRYLAATGRWKLLWIPDHVTSTELRAHTDGPVPYVVYDSAGPAPCEPHRGRRGPVPAHLLLPAVLGLPAAAAGARVR
ncbi:MULTISPECIES: 2,3-bisphosphoglycerate-independent phosphoglycerate mutase [Streptomyces]|uniref:2,3-bisphosphoglycerate-independent phosphoglycerate mutase n=1 Tax=Streptomyces edwardsiae TaxID=3075527 RepID=A0ABU2QFM4_9ACTN|nr:MULTISPECIES: 2,3-bisphosphoglycerate-independent phosphoglycerate mutase [unclassified Streptomyces]MDT0401790.1 2,3-bisphosphoglycerate-independent phosphoglycerate mutase [Streptomyces sp. DSM 41635]